MKRPRALTWGAGVPMLDPVVDESDRVPSIGSDAERSIDFAILADHVPTPLWLSMSLTGHNWVNAAMVDFTGRSVAEHEGQGWLESIHPDDRADYLAVCERAWGEQVSYHTTYRLLRADGVWRRVVNQANPWVEGGRLFGYVGTIDDVHDKLAVVEQLDADGRQFELVLSVQDGLIGATTEGLPRAIDRVVELIGEFTDVDRVGLVRIDHDKETMELEHHWHSVRIAPDFTIEKSIPLSAQPALTAKLATHEVAYNDDVDAMPLERRLDQEMLRRRNIRSNIEIPMVLGGRLEGLLFLDDHHRSRDWVHLVPALKVVGHALAGALGRQRSELALRRSAFRDGLTGLANRALFEDRLEQALLTQPDGECHAAVVLLDLDGFRELNDSLGLVAGDALLVDLSNRLRTITRSEDTVARLGSDVFAILINGSGANVVARALAHRVQDMLESPFTVDGHRVMLSAAIGLSSSAAVATSLVREAELAMSRAKEAGRNAICEFDDALSDQARLRVELLDDLRSAAALGQLRLHYQPSVSLRDGSLLGFEGLLRWQHPLYGLLAPGRFLPWVEESPLIDEIGGWVIEEACRQVAAWTDEFGWAPTIAVNVAPHQLREPGFVTAVSDALSRHRVEAGSLVIEITERSLVDDASIVARLDGLRRLGVRLAIDDFGTGYSSLSYLRRLPVDILKIDQSFVADLVQHGDRARAVVATITELAHVLGLETIAEGIEEEAQLAVLREIGCESGQGYYFAKPAGPDEIAETVLGRTPRSMV